MLDEKTTDALGVIFSKHDYILTTAQLNSYRIYYADIQQLLNDGFIEKIKRGYYHWLEACGEREIKIINRLFPDAVLCMDTALFYYQYSDRNPAEWNITIDKNASRSRTNIDYPKFPSKNQHKSHGLNSEYLLVILYTIFVYMSTSTF